MNDKVAVIIPFYQKQHGILARTLGHVLAQTYTNFMVLIVDDGSPVPAEPEVAAAYPNNNKIVVRRLPNGGPGPARNAGLDLACAMPDVRWIAFVDSDDSWEPDHLARGVQALAAHEGDFYFSNYTWPSGSGTSFGNAALNNKDGEATTVPDIFLFRGDFPLMILSRWPASLSATMIRRDSLGDVRFDKRMNAFLSSEDQMYFLSCARRNPVVLYDCKIGMTIELGLNIFSNKKRGDLAYTLSRFGNLAFHGVVAREMPFLSAAALAHNRRHRIANLLEIVRSELVALKREGRFHWREMWAGVRKYRRQ